MPNDPAMPAAPLAHLGEPSVELRLGDGAVAIGVEAGEDRLGPRAAAARPHAGHLLER
jgi:hypothetical protein